MVEDFAASSKEKHVQATLLTMYFCPSSLPIEITEDRTRSAGPAAARGYRTVLAPRVWPTPGRRGCAGICTAVRWAAPWRRCALSGRFPARRRWQRGAKSAVGMGDYPAPRLRLCLCDKPISRAALGVCIPPPPGPAAPGAHSAPTCGRACARACLIDFPSTFL